MEAIEGYTIKSYGFSIQVKIMGLKNRATNYELSIPKFSVPTLALLDSIKTGIVTKITLSSSEILDPKSIDKIKEKFMTAVSLMLKEEVPNIDESTKNVLIGRLMNEMVGLGDIEFLLLDEGLEEIVVNSSQEPVRVYHKRYGWLITNVVIDSEAKINNYSEIIARRVGRQITSLDPLLDAHLVTGDRANAVLYPISSKGNTITIRKFARDPWTVTDLIKNKTATSQLFALIWLAMQYEMNIIISGGTASGKTSFLNVCMPFIPLNHRILSIEDTRELLLPKFLYWAPLVTRLPNPEGKGEVSMLDLLINSLRMRPDRIILGEIRRQRDAEVLFEAMHTGHSVYATLHADSVAETISRLINPPINVPSNLLEAVHLNVVMFRDRRRGIRRLYQVGEFLVTEEQGVNVVRPNIIYRWKPATDEIIKHSESVKFFDSLGRHTGMSQQEINQDLKEKIKILDFMVKHSIRKIDAVGKVMREFYLNKDNLIKLMNKGNVKEILR
ncbi:CpaF family protein [Candidatus Woesearchaeota archaeon]|nr:CpaF family protein [Candidatus Woesearchaeota archaeon]